MAGCLLPWEGGICTASLVPLFTEHWGTRQKRRTISLSGEVIATIREKRRDVLGRKHPSCETEEESREQLSSSGTETTPERNISCTQRNHYMCQRSSLGVKLAATATGRGKPN